MTLDVATKTERGACFVVPTAGDQRSLCREDGRVARGQIRLDIPSFFFLARRILLPTRTNPTFLITTRRILRLPIKPSPRPLEVHSVRDPVSDMDLNSFRTQMSKVSAASQKPAPSPAQEEALINAAAVKGWLEYALLHGESSMLDNNRTLSERLFGKNSGVEDVLKALPPGACLRMSLSNLIRRLAGVFEGDNCDAKQRALMQDFRGRGCLNYAPVQAEIDALLTRYRGKDPRDDQRWIQM